MIFGLRHGESIPSSQMRVCTSIKAGMDPANGLTLQGREEVTKSSKEWVQEVTPLNLLVLTSPFSRTEETAGILVRIVEEHLNQKPGSLQKNIVTEIKIQERFFGDFEGQGNSQACYEKVWKQDQLNPNHTEWGVESLNQVYKRTSQVVNRYEGASKLIVFVSHGDVLKVLQAVIHHQTPAIAADPIKTPQFKTAEFREF